MGGRRDPELRRRPILVRGGLGQWRTTTPSPGPEGPGGSSPLRGLGGRGKGVRRTFTVTGGGHGRVRLVVMSGSSVSLPSPGRTPPRKWRPGCRASVPHTPPRPGFSVLRIRLSSCGHLFRRRSGMSGHRGQLDLASQTLGASQVSYPILRGSESPSQYQIRLIISFEVV